MATCRLVSATLRPSLAPSLANLESALWPNPWGVDSLRSTLAEPHTRLWVAEDDAGQVLSYCLVQQVLDEATVLQVGTSVKAQRRGLAHQLLLLALETLRPEGCLHVWLEVRAGNQAAIALYRRLGFAVESVRKRYYPPLVAGTPNEDALMMHLSLAAQTT